MNLFKKSALLVLLMAAFVVPQESKAVNWKQWTAIGVGVTFVGVVGYQIYESLNTVQKNGFDDKNCLKFNFEKYNNTTKKSEINDIYSSKETFTVKEYAEKIRELIEEKKKYPFLINALFNIVYEKELIRDVLEYKFNQKDSEEVTLLQISQNSWAKEIIANEYRNFVKKSIKNILEQRYKNNN